jgi:hypothetical protein
MKLIKLFAGLGNQLFQYSYGERLRSRGEKVRYLLFPTQGCLTEVFEIPRGQVIETSNPVASALIKAFAKYALRAYVVGFHQTIENAMSLEGKLRFKRAGDYDALEVLGPIRGSCSVAIHVRGGDYLEEKAYSEFGSVCGPEYYRSAIESIERAVDDPKYFIFTNDRPHAEKVLQARIIESARFASDEVASSDPGRDLYLMSKCTHFIIANSTYSWWGATLGRRDGTMVVAPSHWNASICPSNWIRA